MAEKYSRNPRKRVIRGSSADELRQSGRRRSEEMTPDEFDMPFVRLGSSAIGTGQDVVQRIGDAIIGGDFGGNARGEGAMDVQVTRFSGYDEDDVGIVDVSYVASGHSAVAIGRDQRAAGSTSIALGVGNIADGASSIAIGNSNEALAGLSVAVGLGNEVSEQGPGAGDGIAVGVGNIVRGFRALAVGRSARAEEDYGVAGGYLAVAGDRAVAIGANSYAAGVRSVAIGLQAISLASDQAVIAATAIKMQVSYIPTIHESVITTADTPTPGNLVIWTDSDGIEDAGVAASAFALAAHASQHTNGTDDIQSATASQKGLMTAAYASKLDGIEAGATADQTAAEILTAIKTVDGSGSGLDADLLDGVEGSNYARTDIAETFTDDVIVEGDLTVDQDANVTGDVLATGIVQAAAAWIPGVAVALDAKLYCSFRVNEPMETTYAVNVDGHRGQTGTISGGVIGRPGRFGGAVQIAGATTNFALNPVAGTSGNISALGSATVTTASTTKYWIHSTSLKLVTTAAANDGVQYTLSALANAAHYVTIRTDVAWSTQEWSLNAGANWRTPTLLSSDDAGWYVYGYAFTSGDANGSTSLRIRQTDATVRTVYIGHVQVEAKAYATPPCHGALGTGHSWSGTAHASTSSRTAASLNYASPMRNTSRGTIAFWVSPAWHAASSITSWAHRYLSWGNTTNGILMSNAGGKYLHTEVFAGGSSQMGATYAPAWDGAFHHVAITWETNDVRVYFDGVQRVQDTSVVIPDLSGSIINVGHWSGNSQISGLIDDFVILSRILSADEIRAIYESNVQLICS